MDALLNVWDSDDSSDTSSVVVLDRNVRFSTPSELRGPHFLNRTFKSACPAYEKDITSVLRLQRTIAAPVIVRGFGFWTGEDITVEFRPAPIGTGLVFVRTDLAGQPRIPATVEYREDKPRQTSLAIGNVRIDMIEHLLAALSALRIDNCEIRVDRPEMPGMDGSSAPFFKALEKAKPIAQPAIRPVRIVRQAFRVGDEKSYIDVRPSSDLETIYRYHLDFASNPAIGNQTASIALSPESFKRELMNCRTFLTKSEADNLVAMGLCRRVTAQNVLVFDENGPMENSVLYQNECARHKVLDMVGDFALAPFDWIGDFDAHFSGHHLNAECVRQLFENTELLDESHLQPQDARLQQITQMVSRACA